jgi:hypothetical protein
VLTTHNSVEYKSFHKRTLIFGTLMAEETDKPKTRRTFDSAYGFSFAIAVGLALFIAGLVITLTVGQGTSGLIFGIPLLVAGLVIPLFMMRGQFKTNEIKEPCPGCGETIRTSDATLQLRCPGCHKVINVREEKLFLAEE